MCFQADSNGYLFQSTQCDFVVLSASEYNRFLELTAGLGALTPSEILLAYSWGMGAILLPASIAFAVKCAKKSINLM